VNLQSLDNNSSFYQVSYPRFYNTPITHTSSDDDSCQLLHDDRIQSRWRTAETLLEYLQHWLYSFLVLSITKGHAHMAQSVNGIIRDELWLPAETESLSFISTSKARYDFNTLNLIHGFMTMMLWEPLRHMCWRFGAPKQLEHRYFENSLCSPRREWVPGFLQSRERCRQWERGVAPHLSYTVARTS